MHVPIIMSILLLLVICHQSSSQSSFSPFSLLGSLFNPQPQTRARLDRRHRHPSQGHQQVQHQQIVFRPNIHSGAAGHKFSASQQVPSIARFNEAVLSLSAPPPPSHPSAPPSASSQTPSPPAPPSPAQPQPSQLLESRPNVQRITSPSNFSFTTSFLPASSSNTTVSVTFGFEEITESVTLNSDIEENLPTSDLVPEDTTTTNYAEYENENVHIIYPAVNLTREEGSNSLAAIDSVQNLDDGNTAAADETPTDYQSTLSDDTHFILDSTTATEHTYLRSTITNSDQDENFVEEGTEQAVFQAIDRVDEEQKIGDSFYRQLTSLKTANQISFSPFYSQEEFTYNQDPIIVNHDTNPLVSNEIFEPQLVKPREAEFSIKPRGRGRGERLLERRNDNFDNAQTITQHKPVNSVDFDKILSERLSHANFGEREAIKLVNTIEYKPTDYTGSDNDHIASSYRSGVVGGSDVAHISHNMTRDSLATWVDCGAGTEAGFCSMTTDYPVDTVQSLVSGCDQVMSAWQPLVSQDVDSLGDNSPSVITSQQDQDRPWSWRVYAYKKKQVCHSELYFMRPGFAQDTRGEWQVIIQTHDVAQRVAVDMCHDPELPCPGLADCGKKSRCVQRYNYQMLLSLPASTPTKLQPEDPPLCPSIKAFRFPSGCVCHAEVTGAGDHESESHHHHHHHN